MLVLITMVALLIACESTAENFEGGAYCLSLAERLSPAACICPQVTGFSVTNVEDVLGLTSPTAVTCPGLLDDMWWFAYKVKGGYLHINANTDIQDANDETALKTRDGFYCTGYVLYNQNASGSGRKNTETLRIALIGGNITNNYSKILQDYSLSTPVSIYGLETMLGLGKAVNIETPAFINPTWTFYYKTSTCRIRLYAKSLVPEGVSDGFDSRNFLFSGYWAVVSINDEQKLSNNITASYEAEADGYAPAVRESMQHLARDRADFNYTNRTPSARCYPSLEQTMTP